MRDDTTIGIQKSTRNKLEEMKIHQRETFDDLIKRIIHELDHFRKISSKNKSQKRLV